MQGFVDESRRGRTYLMACVIVSPRSLAGARSEVRQLLLPGQRRVHLTDETKRRARLLATYGQLEVSANIYTTTVRGRSDSPARAACLEALVKDLVEIGGQRLVLESREGRDHQDRAVISTTLAGARDDALVYEHLLPHEEPLLWVADGFAWAYGAGSVWRQHISPRLGIQREIPAG